MQDRSAVDGVAQSTREPQMGNQQSGPGQAGKKDDKVRFKLKKDE